MVSPSAMNHNLFSITRNFRISGRFLSAEPYGNGHINDTYIAWWDCNGTRMRTLHQRINHQIFNDPSLIMDNIARVIRHLRRKLAAIPGADPDREALSLIPTRDGADFLRDPEGNYWRTYVFIENACTYDICETADQAREAARAFGRFQHLLTDLPGGPLHETIPFFHHTPRRFAALRRAIERDGCNRAATAAADIDFALAREPLCTVVTDGLADGSLPYRTTHNDTKLNNVMLDCRTGRGVCVIDLDTVMSGSSLYDFGDLVRTCTRDAPEDQPDPQRDIFRLDLFRPLVEGYHETAGAFLQPAEIELLAISGRLITFTIGIRFLTDYLEGDTYFKTHRTDQNLDRARTQFQLIRSMEQQETAMRDIVTATFTNS